MQIGLVGWGCVLVWEIRVLNMWGQCMLNDDQYGIFMQIEWYFY
jgi:hypothetical protein